MRILHLCLACFYIDGYNYQENVLPRIAKEKGNEVMIIASTETYIDNVRIGHVKPGRYVTEYNVPIIRLPYKKIINTWFSSKIREYKGLYEEIEAFNPKLIFSHDLSYLSLKDVVKYVKKHAGVTLLSDTHTAYYNSGQNWASMHILHKMIYRRVIQNAMPYVEKVYYIGPNEKRFSKEIYGIPESKMEFLPLGGTILSQEQRVKYRKQYRKDLNIGEDTLLLVHSGKLNKSKKTVELIKAYKRIAEWDSMLVIIGSLDEEIKEEVNVLIGEDPRIKYLGWKEANYLSSFLCACDLYCQPGSPSATLQNAICCGCAIMAKELDGYKLLDLGNFIWAETEKSIYDSLVDIRAQKINIARMKENSMLCAERYLDYNRMEEIIRGQVCKDN